MNAAIAPRVMRFAYLLAAMHRELRAIGPELRADAKGTAALLGYWAMTWDAVLDSARVPDPTAAIVRFALTLVYGLEGEALDGAVDDTMRAAEAHLQDVGMLPRPGGPAAALEACARVRFENEQMAGWLETETNAVNHEVEKAIDAGFPTRADGLVALFHTMVSVATEMGILAARMPLFADEIRLALRAIGAPDRVLEIDRRVQELSQKSFRASGSGALN